MKFESVLLGLFSLLLVSCSGGDEVSQPKPSGYFRIDMPEHQYTTLDTAVLPFTFDYAECARCLVDRKSDTAIWVVVQYPQQNASIEMLYKPTADSAALSNLMLADKKFVEFHYQKASGVRTRDFRELGARENVSGLFYDIDGKEVACPFHYWMTDGSHHFARATLYFNFTPNNDSVQPVIDYIREDAMRMVKSFNWR